MARHDADNPAMTTPRTSNLSRYRAFIVRDGLGSLVAQFGFG